MSWIIVRVDDENESEEDMKSLASDLKKIDGVESVEVEGDNPAHILESIGDKLYHFEDLSSLDCPFREMREEIEGVLKVNLRKAHKGSKL